VNEQHHVNFIGCYWWSSWI